MTDRELMQQALDALDYEAECGNDDAYHPLRDALRDRLAQPDAYGYASRLAVAIWEQHYKDVAPQWKPLDDLMGVLTQIDNMTSGLTRLAQPEQEPVAWRNAAIRVGEELSSVGPDGYYDMTAEQWLDWAMAQDPRGKNSLAQPEQEPVAWMVYTLDGKSVFVTDNPTDFSPTHKALPLYTAPRQWQGLTDEEIWELAAHCLDSVAGRMQFARAIEAKLKEKNT